MSQQKLTKRTKTETKESNDGDIFFSINEYTDVYNYSQIVAIPITVLCQGINMPNALVGGINWRATVRRSYQHINKFVPHCLRSIERANSCTCMGQKLLIKPDWMQNCMHFAKKHYSTRSIKSRNSDLKAIIPIKYCSTGQIKITYIIWQGVLYMVIYTLLIYEISKVVSKTLLELWFIAQNTGYCHLTTFMDNVMLAEVSGGHSPKLLLITHNTSQNRHVEFGMPKAKSVPGWEYWIVCHKNIKRHTAHTIVSWPNPKQWIIVHTSDLMMIIRQRNIFSQPSRGYWVNWKNTAPYIE